MLCLFWSTENAQEHRYREFRYRRFDLGKKVVVDKHRYREFRYSSSRQTIKTWKGDKVWG